MNKTRTIDLIKAIEFGVNQKNFDLNVLLKKYPKADSKIYRKSELLQIYRKLVESNLIESSPRLVKLFLTKPTRTMSGVAPVTILTKPFPCPGKCIFCPNDIRMPKSYLSDEPGAQRAERNWFDPYLQTFERLEALKNNGHDISKVEIIILGGTWSFYPEVYQIWFVKEVFKALNQFGSVDNRKFTLEHYQQMSQKLKRQKNYAFSNDPKLNKEALKDRALDGTNLKQKYNQVISELYVAPEKLGGFDQYQSAGWPELELEQKTNELANSRCVGLVVETRPDNISKEEVLRIRRLGATKVQIGFQSLNNEVLEKNHRGHSVAATKRAVRLLRQAGFKIHAHWMPNLYGSTPELDYQDYLKMFTDEDLKPDELKIYPCSLVESAELMQYYQRKLWQPYTEKELLDLLVKCFLATPPYCRLTRVVRDIGSGDIVVGNKKTNFRQLVEEELHKKSLFSVDIRAREIRSQKFDAKQIKLTQFIYSTGVSEEIFIQAVVEIKEKEVIGEKLLGFLRLSLPKFPNYVEELADSAIIREVHVYGQVEAVGSKSKQKAQHLGLGKKMIALAQTLAKAKGFKNLAVISAIGTREYYRKLGFVDVKFYQLVALVAYALP